MSVKNLWIPNPRGYTEIHVSIIDTWMPRTNKYAFKLLMFILYRTGAKPGFFIPLTYQEIIKGTGIKHAESVQKSIKELMDLGLVTCQPGANGEPSCYAYNGHSIDPTSLHKGSADISLIPFYGKCEHRGRTHGPGHVYLLRIDDTQVYKIGLSSDREVRLRYLQTQLPFETSLIYHFHVNDMHCAESYLHLRFAHGFMKGEWFKLTDEDVNWICSLKDEPRH